MYLKFTIWLEVQIKCTYSFSRGWALGLPANTRKEVLRVSTKHWFTCFWLSLSENIERQLYFIAKLLAISTAGKTLYLLCYNFQILFIRDPEHLKACVTHCTESKDQKSTGLTQGVTWCFPKTYLVTSSGSDSTVGLNSTTVIRIRSKRREISDH